MRALVSSPTTIKTWITAATLYFVAAALTIHLTSNGRDIATLWPANAILVALLLADGRPRWKTILSAGFAANIAANLITRGSIIGPLLYGISNLVEIWLVTFLLRRGGSSESILSSSASVLRFLLVAGLVSPAASGLLGAFTAKTFFAEPFGKSLGTWIASDGLGLLVFTPFFLALFRGEFVDCFNSKSWLRRMETAGLIATAAAAAGVIFFVAREPLLFALFPPVMLVTFRVGRIGTKITVMLIAIIGSVGTMRGYG
ncbi:MAG: sensor domain-containing diguanylate cyclase, partial [Alphaproteobacteria bacterium]